MPDGIGGKGGTGSEAPLQKRGRKTNDKREKADNRKTEISDRSI